MKAQAGDHGIERSRGWPAGHRADEGTGNLPHQLGTAPPDQEERTRDFTELVAALAANEVSIARQNRYRDLPTDARPRVRAVVVEGAKRGIGWCARASSAGAGENFPEMPLRPIERVKGAPSLPAMPVRRRRRAESSGRPSSPRVGREKRARRRGVGRLRLFCGFLLLTACLTLLISHATSARLLPGQVINLEWLNAVTSAPK